MAYTQCLDCECYYDTAESPAVEPELYCSCTCEAEDYPRRNSVVFCYTLPSFALINGRPVQVGHA